MSAAYNFDIESPANISADSSQIHCDILNDILNESAVLRGKLIGNRFSHLAEKNYIPKKTEKTNLELMEELGLLGAIEDSQITNINRKKYIQKHFRKRHGKNS